MTLPSSLAQATDGLAVVEALSVSPPTSIFETEIFSRPRSRRMPYPTFGQRPQKQDSSIP